VLLPLLSFVLPGLQVPILPRWAEMPRPGVPSPEAAQPSPVGSPPVPGQGLVVQPAARQGLPGPIREDLMAPGVAPAADLPDRKDAAGVQPGPALHWSAWVLLAWLAGAMGRLLAVDTFRNRLAMWRTTWPLVGEHPWLGLGLDAFYHHYHRRYPGLEEAYSTPHNVVLEFWTRLGLLGLAVAAWLYGAFFAHAGRLYRRLQEPAERVLVLGLLGSVLYGLTHGLLDGAFFAPDWASLFWLAYGLVGVLGDTPSS